MIKPSMIKLTKPELDSIIPKEIIFAEVATAGAMGNVGGIMLYLIKGEQLICYETSVFHDRIIYLLTEKLLLKHTRKINYEDREEVRENLFNHFNAGMGNNVFINKNVTFKIKEGDLICDKDGIEYQIVCSTPAVFNCAAKAMKLLEDDD
ncbi:MAG: hypothetical protein H6609_16360 [Ignavibacteriales bacterium]|nr:hypothetical protein [Ignavibacteriales bacterium]